MLAVNLRFSDMPPLSRSLHRLFYMKKAPWPSPQRSLDVSLLIYVKLKD